MRLAKEFKCSQGQFDHAPPFVAIPQSACPFMDLFAVFGSFAKNRNRHLIKCLSLYRSRAGLRLLPLAREWKGPKGLGRLWLPFAAFGSFARRPLFTAPRGGLAKDSKDPKEKDSLSSFAAFARRPPLSFAPESRVKSVY